ncbi:hypothetical protein EC988_005769 [Linderina pennispora]|nr:hypothetical protein EC988_005769 [Linderina pennispora]
MLSYSFPHGGHLQDTSSPPSPPVERHPSNDDWTTTIVAIMIMCSIAFIGLGILVKKSFQLVPTGVMALRELVDARPTGYHELDNEELQAEEDARLELLSDDDEDASDAHVLHIRSPSDGNERE